MTEAFTHRNHYLPQRYQKGFANDQGRVWLFDRRTLQFRNGDPVNIGVQRDFYTTKDINGVPNDSVEKMLSSLEGKVWPVIDSIDRGQNQVTAEDRAHLALFVAFIKTRTPIFDQVTNQTAELLIKWIAKARNPTPEHLARGYVEATGKSIADDQAQELFKLIHEGDYEVRTPRQNTIKMMLDTAVTLAYELVSMDWTIYTTQAESAFVTSDNPFLVIPPPTHDPTLAGIGPLSEGATSLIPLSKKNLLSVGRNGKGSLHPEKASRDFVRLVNHMIAGGCDRLLIGRDEPHLRKLVKLTQIDRWTNDFRPSMIAPEPL